MTRSKGSGFHSCVSVDVANLVGLRRSLLAWLEGEGVADPPRADVVLATHEATANAIEHSGSATPVVVTAQLSDGMIAVEVSDEGRWVMCEPRDDRGRGFLMIAGLVSKVNVDTDGNGTIVRLLHPILG
jgi:anti-sigma regulatory factor (Ser/Thr protein kinase)